MFSKKNIVIKLTSIAIIIWFFLNIFFAERVIGCGWDGCTYLSFVLDIKTVLHSLSAYYSSRIFPSIVVWLSGYLFHLNINSVQCAMSVFYIYDLIILAIGMYCFYLIAKLRKWSFSIFLIGFTGIFFNFPMLKLITYYPNITDYTAVIFGILILYFYLKDNLIGLTLVIFFSGFTFPSMFITSSLLLLFPQKNAAIKDYPICTMQFQFVLNRYILAFVLSAIMVGLITFIKEVMFAGNIMAPALSITSNILIQAISISCVFVYLLFLLVPFIDKSYDFSVLLFRTMVFILASFLMCYLKIKYLILPSNMVGLTYSSYLEMVVLESIKNPLIFLVSHFVYYGPVILLMVFFWKKMVDEAFQFGVGLALYLLCFSILSIESESRQLINALPVFVFLLCEVLNKFEIQLKFSYVFMLLSLIVSKIWMPMKFASKLLYHYYYFPGLLVYSEDYSTMRAHFMNFGPWMTNSEYLIQGIIMIIIFIALLRWKIRHAKEYKVA